MKFLHWTERRLSRIAISGGSYFETCASCITRLCDFGDGFKKLWNSRWKRGKLSRIGISNGDQIPGMSVHQTK
jgi:hypothetical protein